MLKYLIILLDDSSVSFCHYPIYKPPYTISEDILRRGIMFALKENLSVQFVYPKQSLPSYVDELVESIEHTKIGKEDIVIYDSMPSFFNEDEVCIVRIGKQELMSRALPNILPKRLNIVITDIETFTNDDFIKYEEWLNENITTVNVNLHQINILTDRIFLKKMNNCNAGWETITLAPNGNFYICPAFYQDGMECVGSLDKGLQIKNPQLYQLDYSPICRKCDAFQCKRCVWLNKKTTLEVNTPSHEQCVVAHLERNASRIIAPDAINKIDYLDPFNNITR